MGLNDSGLIAVTGANGFVGRRLCQVLSGDSRPLRRIVRNLADAVDGSSAIGDIGPETQWTGVLAGVDAIVHLAGRAHIMDDPEKDPAAAYHRVNASGTANLARQAAAAGVRRFVFVSSVKVNGDASMPGRPFTPHDLPAPADPYGKSKYEAEQRLMEIAAESRMEVVTVRPPLVYGPGAGGNFSRLMQAVYNGKILPLGSVNNKRSLVALDNLVDLLIRCIDHPGATGETFMVSDGEDISTAALVQKLARVMGERPRLLSVPPVMLRAIGCITGRRGDVERLVGSLQVDIRHTCGRLDWRPPITVDEGLRRAVVSFPGGRG